MRKWYPIILVIVMIVFSVFAYPRLPNDVPTHWDFSGQVNGYTSKLMAVVLLPCLFLGIWAVTRALPTIDPWRPNYAKMQGAYDLVVNAVLTLLALSHLVVLGAALGAPISVGRIIPVAVGALFIVMGNVLPRARPNFWFGIRTPWTLTNTRVWERTHRVGGYITVVAGMLIMVSALLPFEIAGIAIIVIGVAASLIAVIYSYFAWRQETS